VELDPALPDAQASLGAVLLNRHAIAEARPHLERAVALRPAEPMWRYNLALCDVEDGRFDEAAAGLEAALRSRPEWPEALNTLGSIHVSRGDAAAGRALIDSALRLSPSMASAWNNLGVADAALGNLPAAREAFQRCISLAPRDPTGWIQLGNVERTQGHRDAAERAYRQATSIAPENAGAWQNLGNLLREAGQLDEAVASLEHAVQRNGGAPAHMGLAVALLASGKLQRAWKEYAWRSGVPPRAVEEILAQSRQAPSVLAIESEQGLGDSLFFLRWAGLPEWRAGLDLRWEGDPRLDPLLEGTGLSLDRRGGSSARVRVAAGELPRLAGSSTVAHPAPLALALTQALRDDALKALEAAGPGPYLAVAWRAGSPPRPGEEVLTKRVPLGLFARALASWRGTLVSVQRHPEAGEIDELRRESGRPVLDAAAFNEDLPRMAGLLSAVDLYAGVSSTNVHIAAGVGGAARILVPYPPDWRYAGKDATTPWFPGYALHRQDPEGGWERSLGELSAALAARAP